VSISIHVHGAGGKMGRMVVAAAGGDPGISLSGTSGRGDDLARHLTDKRVDVLVEFTNADSAPDHVRTALECGVHVVSGTTGIAPPQIAALAELAESSGRGVVLAPNFALGMVLMQRFAEQAARYFPDAEILELHHEQKRDAPSGTAMATARRMSLSREHAHVGPAPRPAEHVLVPGARGGGIGGIAVHSVRLPGLIAHQEVWFGGIGQLLTLRHDAFDRRAYWPGIRLAILGIGARRGLLDSIEPFLDDSRP
jgi:4-hydroxy-tetrahydrodipicolinate reductase